MSTASDDLQPIFIGGCGRSGTTMLGDLLGTHPEIVTPPEAVFVRSLVRALDASGGRLPASTIRRTLADDFYFQLWRVDLDTLLAGRADDTVLDAAQLGDLLRSAARRYAERRGRDTTALRFWVDHTPFNLRHAASLQRLFPQARFIHLLRDGRAVANSMLPLDWGPNSISSAARWWMVEVGHGLAAEGYLGDRCLRIRFEDLVADPATTVDRLGRHLGIRTVDAMTTGGGLDRPRYTEGQHRLVGRPPDPSVARRWEHELSQEQIARFQFITADLLPHLGYDLVATAPYTTPGLVRRGREVLEDQARTHLVNPIRARRRRRAATGGDGDGDGHATIRPSRSRGPAR